MIQESTTMRMRWSYWANYLPMFLPHLTSTSRCMMNNKGSQVECDASKRTFHSIRWKDTFYTEDDQSCPSKMTYKRKSYGSIMIT